MTAQKPVMLDAEWSSCNSARKLSSGHFQRYGFLALEGGEVRWTETIWKSGNVIVPEAGRSFFRLVTLNSNQSCSSR